MWLQSLVCVLLSHLADDAIMAKMLHTKARGSLYPFGGIRRLTVPDDLVPWTEKFENYAPPEYNSPNLKGKPWADPDINDKDFKPKWNDIDETVNRKSYMGVYSIVNGRPLNPMGRTGLCGRGVLGKWGPNHAADPLVTRWKIIDGKKQISNSSSLPVLQFCAIQRRDCEEWALPGGMVDPGEQVSETLKREFLEEAFNSLEGDKDKVRKDEEMVKSFFTQGTEIYKGYVDDPRNSDNAWMETVAVNFHDESGDQVGKFSLQAGDDAKGVQWLDINKDLKLYASHSDLIKTVAELRQAHW